MKLLIACRRCSNYIFILYLMPGFSGLGKDNCKKHLSFGIWCDLYERFDREFSSIFIYILIRVLRVHIYYVFYTMYLPRLDLGCYVLVIKNEPNTGCSLSLMSLPQSSRETKVIYWNGDVVTLTKKSHWLHQRLSWWHPGAASGVFDNFQCGSNMLRCNNTIFPAPVMGAITAWRLRY